MHPQAVEHGPNLRFILVTGNVGAGKSTLALALEARLVSWVRVDADLYANQIDEQMVIDAERRGDRRRPRWKDSRVPGYAQARKRVVELASEDRRVILGACIPQRAEVESFCSAARAEAYDSRLIIQLKCTLDTSLQRRIGSVRVPIGWGPPNSRSRFLKLYEMYNSPLNTFNFDLPGALCIETDGMGPEQVLGQVLPSIRPKASN